MSVIVIVMVMVPWLRLRLVVCCSRLGDVLLLKRISRRRNLVRHGNKCLKHGDIRVHWIAMNMKLFQFIFAKHFWDCCHFLGTFFQFEP